jgi:AraC-like DNA-binding protein
MTKSRLRPVTAATTVAFVKTILLAYERYGADPAGVLEQAQIAPATLQDADAKITAVQMEILTAGAMRQLDDEALGWFSRKLPWGSYGMLCRASLSSPNLGIALRRWFRHHRLLIDDIEITLAISPDRVATVAIDEHRNFGKMRELCLLTYLRFVHGYACWAIDSRIPLLHVGLPIESPLHSASYARMFPGPVEFNQARASFSFEEKYLGLAHQRDEPALRIMLQRPLPLTILLYRRDRLLVQRIRKLLATSSEEMNDAEAVARHLHISSRTMYRQLHDEGTSFQRIKDEVRRERAIHLLTNTNKQIKQIAMSLGYSSDKSFTRAFRTWSGETPQDYRSRATSPA